MNQIRDALGPLLTTQGFGFLLMLAGATIGCASVIASGLSEQSESNTAGEVIALGICLVMIAVGLWVLLFPEHAAQIKFPLKEVFG